MSIDALINTNTPKETEQKSEDSDQKDPKKGTDKSADPKTAKQLKAQARNQATQRLAQQNPAQRGQNQPTEDRPRNESAFNKEARPLINFLNQGAGKGQTRQYAQVRQIRANPQNWGVRNCRHCPPQAKKVIAQRQAQLKSQPKPEPQTKASTESKTEGGEKTQQDANIQLATPRSTPPGPPPFAHRATRVLIQRLRQVAKQVQTQKAQAQANQNSASVTLRRGSLAVLFEGSARLFRLQKESRTFREITTRGTKGNPLSPRGRRALIRILGRRSMENYQQKLRQQEALEKQSEKTAEKAGQQVGKENTQQSDSLDFASKFAVLLYLALEEGKKLEKKLKAGEDPKLGKKEDWAAFFGRMAKVGNVEKSQKKNLDSLLSLLFRGVYDKKGKGQHLIGDLKFLKNGKSRTENFAQIPLSEAKIQQLLNQLKPGQSLNTQALQEFFDQELRYTKMAHTGEGSSLPQADSSEKNVKYDPKAQVDLFSQAKFEKALLKNKKDSLSKIPLEAAALLPEPNPRGVFANPFELMGSRERYSGKMKLYTWLSYAVLAGSLGVGLIWIISRFI